MGHYFFFSYARLDLNRHVEKFFDELCAEIRSHAGVGEDVTIGFRDNLNIPLGREWETALLQALSDSATFVALCTPSYFKSHQCGREWALFHERLAAFASAERPPVMLPLLWVRHTKLPAVARQVQYATDQLGARYPKEGLLNWVRRGFHQRRAEFVEALAEHIIQAKERYDLPPLSTTDRFESVISAFKSADAAFSAPAIPDPVIVTAAPASPVAGKATVRADKGTDQKARTVNFVVAAGTLTQMRDIRRQTEYYKDRDRDWEPYPHATPPSLAMLASQVALDNDFGARIRTIEELPGVRETIREYNELVVLLMDAWVTRSASKREAVQRFNDGAAARDVVLVPLNEEDIETYLEWRALKTEVLTLLEPYFTEVGEHRPLPLPVQDLTAMPGQLLRALVAANNDLFREGVVRRWLPGDDDGDLPFLSAPTK
ncbi:TIR-like protein FxsC [Dactylosporangium salmoneum]|uniref:TIR-like protein FxsC n=1 Tax=Dactylosporangium salmoneum TaxID=53361 RepID=UPI0031DC10DD